MSSIILRPEAARSKCEPFAAVPHAVAADPRLSATAVRVYAALLYFLRDRPSCSPTNADLGRRACCSVATVKRALAALEAAGVVGRLPDANPTGRRLVAHRRATPGAPVGHPRRTDEPPPAQGRAAPPLTDEPPPGAPVSHSEEAEREGRNVTRDGRDETDLSLPGDAASPGPSPGPAPAPRPSAPVRPLLEELKALPGADEPRVRSLAWRLAHYLADVASVAFFATVLRLVAAGTAPLERLLDAFRVADRSRGKARKPGAIFASAWSSWQPPPLPSAIRSYQQPTAAAVPDPPEPPPMDRAREIRELIIMANDPRHPFRRVARDRLAELGAGVAAEGHPAEAAPRAQEGRPAPASHRAAPACPSRPGRQPPPSAADPDE